MRPAPASLVDVPLRGPRMDTAYCRREEQSITCGVQLLRRVSSTQLHNCDMHNSIHINCILSLAAGFTVRPTSQLAVELLLQGRHDEVEVRLTRMIKLARPPERD